MSDAAEREIAQCYEDIREKDAEIERMKNKLFEAGRQTGEIFIAKDAEVQRLKALLSRAADVLDGYDEYRNFIAELRKAAQ